MKGGENPWKVDPWSMDWHPIRPWWGKRALRASQARAETLAALRCGLKGHPLSRRRLFWARGDKSREALSHGNRSAGSRPAVCWPVWECHGGPSPSPNKPNPLQPPTLSGCLAACHSAPPPVAVARQKKKKLFQTTQPTTSLGMEQNRIETVAQTGSFPPIWDQ